MHCRRQRSFTPINTYRCFRSSSVHQYSRRSTSWWSRYFAHLDCCVKAWINRGPMLQVVTSALESLGRFRPSDVWSCRAVSAPGCSGVPRPPHKRPAIRASPLKCFHACASAPSLPHSHQKPSTDHQFLTASHSIAYTLRSDHKNKPRFATQQGNTRPGNHRHGYSTSRSCERCRAVKLKLADTLCFQVGLSIPWGKSSPLLII